MLKSSAGVSPVLPAEYQRVEWVKCDENSWFLINRNPTSGMQISVDGAIGVTNVNNSAVISSGASSLNGNVWYIACQTWTTAWVIRSHSDNSTGLATAGTKDTNRHLFTINSISNTASIDETSVNLPFSTHIPSYPIYIGRNVLANSSLKLTIYSALITENGSISMNLFPCFRKSDGVIGLYDIISDNFLTNNGTGVLTKGANI